MNNQFNSFLRSTAVEDDTVISETPKSRYNTVTNIKTPKIRNKGGITDRILGIKKPKRPKKLSRKNTSKHSKKQKTGNNTATPSATDLFGRHKEVRSFQFSHISNLMTKTNNPPWRNTEKSVF